MKPSTMGDNPSEASFFNSLSSNHPRTKPNPFPNRHHSFPITSPSIIMNNNSSHCNNSPLQQQQQGALSLSLSFAAPVVLPLGPFTGYATILDTSRFLRPAQLILDDLFGFVNSHPPSHHHTPADHDHDHDEEEASMFGTQLEGFEHRRKNSNLMLMLHEVYKRYRLYCEQMKSVVASFEAVAGLGNAAPFIPNAIKIVSFHFTSLKNALLHQIHCFKDQSDSVYSQSNNNIKPFSTTTFNLKQHPVWRSHKMLPDHAVSLLKSWLFEHFLHPYPTDSEKQILAQQTGLSRTQVSNWFINARVRVWKPMVEEIHSLESEQKAAVASSSSLASIGNKRTRFSSEQEEDHCGYSSSDGVSLALALPPRTHVPISNPSWHFPVNAAANPSVGNHEFAGGISSNQFYGHH